MDKALESNGLAASSGVNQSLAHLGGTFDSSYFQSLLAEKDKEIQKLQKMLE